MRFSHVSIGGGITGLETIISALEDIQKKIQLQKKIRKKLKNKKFTFTIIEKDPKNIPGGVAYGFAISQYGYFNNPIRLSPRKFIRWLLKKNNKRKLKDYLNLYGGFTGKKWLKKNQKILNRRNNKKIDELYIPRTLLNLWMEEKLLKLLSKINKINKKYSIFITLNFIKGEVINIKKNKKNYNEIIIKNDNCYELKFKNTGNKFKKLNFTNYKKINESIYSKTINLGIGLPPPRQLATKAAQKNNNYIWDFYSEGSTSTLIKKISKLANKKNKLRVYFIGFKAGLLESLPELKEVIINNKKKIELLCSSKDLKSIQKAEPSYNKKDYVPKYLNQSNINKIFKAKSLYNSLINEFRISKSLGYNKYDAWTYILKNNVLHKCINKFTEFEKLKYNNIFHHKIRNLTRFTYPETIRAKEKLLKMKILKTKKENVIKVEKYNSMLLVTTSNHSNKRKKYLCDLVVNVSGPLNPKLIRNEIPLIKSLKKNGAKVTTAGGFAVDNNFKLKGLKNVYSPGILSNGFNPERKTIIKAILENSKKSGQSIAKTLIGI